MVVKVTRTFTAPIRGVGKPDYTREVSAGRQRVGITAAYNQTLKYFGVVFSNVPSFISWVRAPLAVGERIHLYDMSTGLVMPFTVPQGYTFTAVEVSWNWSVDAMGEIYYEPSTPPGLQLILCPGHIVAGRYGYIQDLTSFSTKLLDPIGASAHLIDYHIISICAEVVIGGMTLLGLLEAVGTKPLPTTKTVKCKFCGNEQTVSIDTSEVICSECSKLNIYFNLSQFRGTS